VIDELRSGIGPNRKTPVVLVMSSRLERGAVEKLKPAVQGFFVKPLDSLSLVQRLRAIAFAPRARAA
jgi:hypothetical protein